jgi:hypothetical protein
MRAALLLAVASISAAHTASISAAEPVSTAAAQPTSPGAAQPTSTSAAHPAAPADAFAQLEGLSGDWEADLPGYGKMHDTVRLISNGTAIEETIGTAADNEASIYIRDGDRILITHYCAMTPDGHQVRLESAPLNGTADRLEFVLVGSTNLHDPKAPHMRRMSMTLVDRDHFSERWTKTEAGKDTVFELNFTRR